MSAFGFPRVAGVVFAVVALAHAYRAVAHLPVQVGSAAVPEWLSWMAFVGAGALSVWGLRWRG